MNSLCKFERWFKAAFFFLYQHLKIVRFITCGFRILERKVMKVAQEGNFIPTNQNLFDYTKSAIQGGMNIAGNFSDMRKMNVTDKYKHAMMNCNAARYGQGGADMATLASNIREWIDKRTGSNTLDSSEGDQYANRIGRLLGGKYPEEDCDELVQRYIKKNW